MKKILPFIITALLSITITTIMNESEYRKIAREEAQKLFDQNYDSGTVGAHQHDGADNVQISQANLKEFIPATTYQRSSNTGIFSFGQKVTGNGNLQFPVIQGTQANNIFQGGFPRNGTMVVQFTPYNYATLQFYLIGDETKLTGTFTGSLLAGATSATLSSAWTNFTGTYPLYFSNGDVRNVTLTNNATTATWTGGLSGSATSAYTVILPGKGGWYGVQLNQFTQN